MEKLTLEQIAPYLPYGLKIFSNIHNRVDLITGTDITHLGNNRFYLKTDANCDYADGIMNIKPILRKCDLTKPIMVNGKEEVPAMVLAKIVADIHNNDMDDKWAFSDSGYVNIKTPWDLKIQIFYKTPTLMFSVYDTWNYKEKRTHNQLLAFQYLFKHKFDIFGLISKGLAVDADTLKTNPYND